MQRFAKELSERGKLVGTEGLTPPGQARIVRAKEDGSPEVTDGPLPESKACSRCTPTRSEFWRVTGSSTSSREQAYAIAARASAAPGPGSAPLNLAIEVREVMSAPPK